MKREYALYQVALKALVRRGPEYLFLKCKIGNELLWDLPGGRIDDCEHQVPFQDILAREVAEEVGAKFKYMLGIPLFQFRRPFRLPERAMSLSPYMRPNISPER